MSEYGGHDPEELGDYYTKHVMAMTAEKLHHKGDIAVELAYRDKRIAELEDRYMTLTKQYARDCDRIEHALELEAENQRLKEKLKNSHKIDPLNPLLNGG